MKTKILFHSWIRRIGIGIGLRIGIWGRRWFEILLQKYAACSLKISSPPLHLFPKLNTLVYSLSRLFMAFYTELSLGWPGQHYVTITDTRMLKLINHYGLQTNPLWVRGKRTPNSYLEAGGGMHRERVIGEVRVLYALWRLENASQVYCKTEADEVIAVAVARIKLQVAGIPSSNVCNSSNSPRSHVFCCFNLKTHGGHLNKINLKKIKKKLASNQDWN